MIVTRRHFLGVLAALSLLGRSSYSQSVLVAPQKIGIIGSGRMGGTVGRLWADAGHEVMFSSRNPNELKKMIGDMQHKVSVGYPREAAQFGTILFFATPYLALEQLGKELFTNIQGKIVLDATNPRAGATDLLSQQAESEGFGVVSARLLKGSRLVRAFSAVDSWAIEESSQNKRPKMGVPIAGDDPEAIDVAALLVRSAGCQPVVVGNLQASRQFDRGGPGWLKDTTASQLRLLLKLPQKRAVNNE